MYKGFAKKKKKLEAAFSPAEIHPQFFTIYYLVNVALSKIQCPYLCHYLFKAWVCLFLWQLNKLYFFWSLLVCRIHYTIQTNHVWILIYSVFKKLLFYFLTPKWVKIWLFWVQIKCNFGVFLGFGVVLQCFRMSGNAFLRIPVSSAFSIYL